MSALSSYLGCSLITQSLIFIGSSLIFVFIVRYWLLGKLVVTQSSTHTNVYAMQGKRGIVLQAIKSYGVGQVKINGEIWTARAVQDNTIEKGALVSVVRVSGSRVIVEEIKTTTL